jgi:hypothetical protein
MKSEIRNPKAEGRPKFEIRKELRLAATADFQISAFGLPSDFGPRISDF